VRVVAGRFGGRTLRAPPGRDTRPTSDRVREALFSMLGPLDGVRVLDLYAGSGALGIEALSRGAARVTFVERRPPAQKAIAGNLAAVGAGSDEAVLVRGAARTAIRDASERGEAYDLILLDPPYRDAPGLGRELSQSLVRVLAPGGRVVAESDRRAPLDLTGLTLTHERRYGDTLIRIHLHDA
jgi:16S rRNA (guanine966-N2)-methyltransferase